MNRAYIIAVLAALLAIGLFFSSRRTPHQPRTSPTAAATVSQTRMAEVTDAEPTYVGRETCKECHAENYHLHGKHGHSHTFTSASDPEIVSKFAGRTYDTGMQYGTYTYHANEDGLFVRIPERFGDDSFPLQYALGSGHHAYTLLSLMPDPKKETVGIEHRASWFRDGDRLGPTPGQVHTVPETLSELFGQKHVDKVMHKCVYCHTTTGTIVGQQIVNLTPNVNCEKCHGPASEHVRLARVMETPPPFSVGRHDWDVESEIQLCGDCHRLPAAISRKELREYPDSLTRFQPVGMLRSECYLASDDGQFKCTTCHSPHTSVTATPQADYVQTCVSCHLPESESHVACPVSPSTGCIQCHMPPVLLKDVGASFHDHWIRIRDDE